MFRPGGVTYVRIPAPQPAALAGFYRDVFAWTVDRSGEQPKFADGSGHVIGHFVADQRPTGAEGVRLYIYVASVSETLAALGAHGARVVTPAYAEGSLTVATFEDPAGNVVGVWQLT